MLNASGVRLMGDDGGREEAGRRVMKSEVRVPPTLQVSVEFDKGVAVLIHSWSVSRALRLCFHVLFLSSVSMGYLHSFPAPSSFLFICTLETERKGTERKE